MDCALILNKIILTKWDKVIKSFLKRNSRVRIIYYHYFKQKEVTGKEHTDRSPIMSVNSFQSHDIKTIGPHLSQKN